MLAHQIIQTSCRRGINGGGSGFQIFSCDEGLYLSGMLNGTEYQKLFVYDTPVEVGVSSFGYAPTEDGGSIFSLNTRLEHDFGGAGTRSGNLLNHSIATSEAIGFYPAEMFGSAVLRTEMLDSEVNSDKTPDYLPQAEIGPAGVVDGDAIAEWLEECDGIETLERLIGAFARSRQESKTLVIFDTPSNVIRWIAAIEYCLPVKVARTIGFLNYSENAANAKAAIVGTSHEQFKTHTPSYMLASVLPFDPDHCSEHPLPEGPYIDFVDISYSLNAPALSEFAAFSDRHIVLDETFALDVFDNVYAVYSLMREDVGEWSTSVIRSGLQYAQSKGSPQLNAALVEKIEQHHAELSNIDSNAYLEILEYLIRRWPSLDAAGQQFVEKVAVGNVLGILQQPDMSETEFQDYFDAITKSCASAGLHIFELLMGDESRSMLFASAGQLAFPKLRQLALSLTEFVIAGNLSERELEAHSTLGTLYVCLEQCAISQGVEPGINLAQSIVSQAAPSLPHLENLMLTLDLAMVTALDHAGIADSQEGLAALDAFWDTFAALVVEYHKERIRPVVDWLTWASECEPSRYPCMVELYERLAPLCQSPRESSDLFEAFCQQRALRSPRFMIDAYPHLASRYAASLRSYDDPNAYADLRKLLESSLSLPHKLDFVPGLMESVSQSFNLKKTSSPDLRLIAKAREYEYRTGGSALVGRAALIEMAGVLEDAQRLNDPRQAIAQLEGIASSPNLESLDARARKDYLKRIAPAAIQVIRSEDDVHRIICAFGMRDDVLYSFMTELCDVATKKYIKRGDHVALTALILFAIRTPDLKMHGVCDQALSSIKSEDGLRCLDDKMQRAIGSARNTVEGKRWNRIFNRAADRAGKSLLGRFRR